MRTCDAEGATLRRRALWRYKIGRESPLPVRSAANGNPGDRRTPRRGWRARCRHPVEASATGDTRCEATQALEAILRTAVSDPLTLLPLEVTPDKPWIAFAGSIPDDTLTDEWLNAIAENRRNRDCEDCPT